MGYRTPNIDRIADEGMRFTDSMASRAAPPAASSFITGRACSAPGSARSACRAPTSGCAPRTRRSPSCSSRWLRHRPVRQEPPRRPRRVPADRHGFDEFFGNLYHLNAEEEPELPDYPPTDGLPRLPGALRPARRAPLLGDRRDDATEDPRSAASASSIEDTGPLTKKRMETIDDEFARRARATSSSASTRPARRSSCWFNTTHMHFRTHAKPESLGPGRTMAVAIPRHDDRPRQGTSAQCSTSSTSSASPTNTIVIYSTDNGPHMNTWPDAGMTPFRSEKNTNWEGAFRVPAMVRWPGKIKAGTSPTRSSAPRLAADVPRRRRRAGHHEKLLEGHRPATRLQGPPRRLQPPSVPDRRGRKEPAPGVLLLLGRRRPLALRYDNWKLVFMEQRVRGHVADLGRALRDAARARRCSTSGPTRTSGPTSPRTPTTTGSSTTTTCSRGTERRRRVPCNLPGVPAAPESRRASRSTRWSRSWRRHSQPGADDGRSPCVLERQRRPAGNRRLR